MLIPEIQLKEQNLSSKSKKIENKRKCKFLLFIFEPLV